MWKKCNVFDRLVVLNLFLLLMGMAAHVLPLAPAAAHTVALATQVLATIAVVLLVLQLVKTVQSVASMLRGPELAWSGSSFRVDLTTDPTHLNRARHWLRRGKTDESVREVFGDQTYQQARRLNDDEDASTSDDRRNDR